LSKILINPRQGFQSQTNSNTKKPQKFLPTAEAGLPDGISSYQKSQFGKILEGLGMQKAGIFYGRLECITTTWYILWPCGNVVAIWYIFPCFGILCQVKSGNPGLKPGLQYLTDRDS
jgi:hypothetical protein